MFGDSEHNALSKSGLCAMVCSNNSLTVIEDLLHELSFLIHITGLARRTLLTEVLQGTNEYIHRGTLKVSLLCKS